MLRRQLLPTILDELSRSLRDRHSAHPRWSRAGRSVTLKVRLFPVAFPWFTRIMTVFFHLVFHLRRVGTRVSFTVEAYHDNVYYSGVSQELVVGAKSDGSSNWFVLPSYFVTYRPAKRFSRVASLKLTHLSSSLGRKRSPTAVSRRFPGSSFFLLSLLFLST